jgi:hypothetical protein
MVTFEVDVMGKSYWGNTARSPLIRLCICEIFFTAATTTTTMDDQPEVARFRRRPFRTANHFLHVLMFPPSFRILQFRPWHGQTTRCSGHSDAQPRRRPEHGKVYLRPPSHRCTKALLPDALPSFSRVCAPSTTHSSNRPSFATKFNLRQSPSVQLLLLVTMPRACWLATMTEYSSSSVLVRSTHPSRRSTTPNFSKRRCRPGITWS